MKRGREKKNKKWVLVLVIILLVASAASVTIYLLSRDSEASKTCTTFVGSRDKQCASDYIGLTKEEAEERADKYSLYVRYSTIDSVGMVNNDLGADSVMFDIEKNIVTRVCFSSVQHGWTHGEALCYPKTLEELLYSK